MYLTKIKSCSSQELLDIDDIANPIKFNGKQRYFKKLKNGVGSIVHNMYDELMTTEDIDFFRDLSGKSKLRNAFILAAGSGFWGIESYNSGTPKMLECNMRTMSFTFTGVWAGRIANDVGFTDVLMTDSSACASAGNAVHLAKMLIKSGEADRVFIVALENAIHRTTIDTFTLHHICLTKKQQEEGAKPSAFDPVNYGFNLGQASAYALIESEEAMKESGLQPIAKILATSTGGEECSNHLSQDPAGLGYKNVISRVLRESKLCPDEIQLVKSHGTGSKVNNESEGGAIRQFFNPGSTLVTSYKPLIGHTFGPSVLVELDLMLQDIKRGELSGILNRTNDDDFFISKPTPISNVTNIMTLGAGMSNVFNALVLSLAV